MYLFIEGVEKKQFNVEKVLFEEGQVLLRSAELSTYINGLQNEIAALTLPPAAPAAPVYELIEAANLPYTIEQFKAAKWSEQQLIDAGHLIRVEVVQDAPAPVAAIPSPPETAIDSPIAGQFVEGGVTYMMTLKAAGASFDQFKTSGWSIDQLVSGGYVDYISGGKAPTATKVVPAAGADEPWPRMNAEGDWVDIKGTVFNIDLHSMSANKIPAMSVKNTFNKTRSRKAVVALPPVPTDEGVPTAPAAGVPTAPAAGVPTAPAAGVPTAPSASGVPSAPAAGVPSAPAAASGVPSAPSANDVEDEPLDDELSSLIKDWT